MSLTKQQILSTPPRLKKVEVPEWGEAVFIRPLTVLEHAKLADIGTKYEKASNVDRMKNCTMRLVQWSVCDEQGNPLFETSDIEALMNKPTSAVPAPAGRNPRLLRDDGRVPQGTGKKLAERPERRARFRLAETLGRTVAELEQTLTYPEFLEWIAYFRLEAGGAPASAPPWQKMMQSMRLVTELQRARQ